MPKDKKRNVKKPSKFRLPAIDSTGGTKCSMLAPANAMDASAIKPINYNPAPVESRHNAQYRHEPHLLQPL